MTTSQTVDRSSEKVHWHVEGKNGAGELLYSATIAAEAGPVSGAAAAIAHACNRLADNGYDARIIVTWVASLYCPGAKS